VILILMPLVMGGIIWAEVASPCERRTSEAFFLPAGTFRGRGSRPPWSRPESAGACGSILLLAWPPTSRRQARTGSFQRGKGDDHGKTG
jgi:hypothetical protein